MQVKAPAHNRPCSPRKTAELLGVHINTVYALIQSGEIAAFRVGNALRVPAEEIARIKSTPAAAA